MLLVVGVGLILVTLLRALSLGILFSRYRARRQAALPVLCRHTSNARAPCVPESLFATC